MTKFDTRSRPQGLYSRSKLTKVGIGIKVCNFNSV